MFLRHKSIRSTENTEDFFITLFKGYNLKLNDFSVLRMAIEVHFLCEIVNIVCPHSEVMAARSQQRQMLYVILSPCV